jgi:redox-sensing transcriptional repressor|uniref:Redox-sensing transcriptional repressor Rex n=1 Tax=Thermodesulfobacterium geofontis TaxID=1295609 RepID=A0A7V5N1N4_9BACT
MKVKDTPENTLERLIIYLKVLEALEKRNVDFISSEDLAKNCGVNSAQLRKDLSFVGSLGTKGVGYSIKSLKFSLKNFLGRAKEWNLILGGLSPLGIFLLQDKILQKEGFYFLAAFDNKEENIGKIYNGIVVYNLNQLSQVVSVIKVDIGVITAEEDPEIFLKAFIDQGIKAILNLSKIPLFVENSEIKIENFSFSIALTKLSYFLKG